MMRPEDWNRMSLVERGAYEASVRQFKRIALVGAIAFGICFVATAAALFLHSKGIL